MSWLRMSQVFRPAFFLTHDPEKEGDDNSGLGPRVVADLSGELLTGRLQLPPALSHLACPVRATVSGLTRRFAASR